MLHSQQTVQSMIDSSVQDLGAVCGMTVRWKSITVQLPSLVSFFLFCSFLHHHPPPLFFFSSPQSELNTYAKMLSIHLLAWEGNRERANRDWLHCIAL